VVDAVAPRRGRRKEGAKREAEHQELPHPSAKDHVRLRARAAVRPVDRLYDSTSTPGRGALRRATRTWEHSRW
jgi:hypothetical protein